MRLFAPVIISLLLVPIASCGSRDSAPTAATPTEQSAANGPPAPGEAQRVGSSDDNVAFNARMSQWMKDAYYGEIIMASRARAAQDSSFGGAQFSLVYALYYNGAFAEAAAQGQKLAAMPAYQNDPKVTQLLTDVRAMAGRYPGQNFAPITWEPNEVDVSSQKWQQLGDSLIKAGNYDEIERTAATLTNKPEIRADGSWTLAPFFVGLWSGDDDSEASWQAARERIESWVAAKPNSQLAQVCLARVWTAGAWLARGSGYSDKVPESAWKTVEERQDKAAPIIRKLLNAPKITTPLVYSSAQRYGQLGSAPRDWQDKIFARGVAAFPQYTDFYLQRATQLLERWGGAPGEWEQDAAKYADLQPDKTAGDMLYARIVWGQWDWFPNLHDAANVDWPRTKRGFDGILKYYPGSLAASTVYLRLCHQWKDYAQARQVLQIIGGRGDSGAWESRRRWAQTRNFLLKAP